MKRLLIRILILIVALLAFSTNPPPVSAQQGTYTCAIVSIGGNCGLGVDNCNPGYTPNATATCNTFSTGSCTSAGNLTCVVDPTCGGTNDPCCEGVCRNSTDTCTPSNQLGISFCVPNDWTPPEFGLFPIEGNDAAFCNTDYTQVRTAIGCISVNSMTNLINDILSWAMGISGGIALILIIYASLQFATAQGDPKRVKAAQELLTSAFAGLVLIVFAVLILNFLGVNVLGISQWFS